MPQIRQVHNPMNGWRTDWMAAGTFTKQQTTQVLFAPGELKEIEIAHARGLTREGGASFALLIRISERMKEKNISYRDAYLELRA